MNPNIQHFSFDFTQAVKVRFKKPIFEEDFVEKGMIAWLTDIEWCEKASCYQLYFDFEDFEEENKKYFKRTYYSNISTKEGVAKGLFKENRLYTAIEAGIYDPKYSSYFSIKDDCRNDRFLELELLEYLHRLP